MNAHAMNLTATDLASALMGKPRAVQSVFVSAKVYNGSPLGPKFIVLVTPDGSERGEYYEVWQRGLDALRGGMTPAELELEPYQPEADEGDGSAWDREASRGDREYQQRMEGVR